MTVYTQREHLSRIPRLPLEGSLDLTYRCNNNCQHCWLRIPPGSPEKQRELTLEEIIGMVDAARAMGCRRWSISGGEPMLRPDFADAFDYITSRATSYSLNTNGTLITPKIAQLMKRKGVKMVALYGATADVQDRVTRNPGSYEATMRGFAYLKEAGAGFVVQVIPMRDNYHQFQDMIRLAESLSSHYRIGAAWLYLSACGDPHVNCDIARQRLDPRDVIELDKPDLSYEGGGGHEYAHIEGDDRLFAPCINGRRDFHVDPYGLMTFCGFVKDPAMLYDLRAGSFQECWEQFIPSLAEKVHAEQEYYEGCGSCELRSDCRWCPVYGYLEHGRFSAKVDYLCDVAQESRKYKEEWLRDHRRYYQCAGITMQVDSDLPITDTTFHPKFKLFEVSGPGEDTVTIRHHFSLPDLSRQNLGAPVYRRPPWAIYKSGDSWVYVGISPMEGDPNIHRVAVFNSDHTRARIYNDAAREKTFQDGNLASLTLFPTDQILLAQLLADRQGCYLHSCGVVLDGQGLLFVGHSEAGKSTTTKLLRGHAEILCDDRIIIRQWADGFKIHGTWSHGEVPDVSSASAPLKSVLFLIKDTENRIVPITDTREAIRKMLACLIKPFVTAEWWEKTLNVVEQIAREVPCYDMHFDKSGQVVDLLRDLAADR
jgi:MoaA/NifB/PqqE/SkfB family radical SAM enzyme